MKRGSKGKFPFYGLDLSQGRRCSAYKIARQTWSMFGLCTAFFHTGPPSAPNGPLSPAEVQEESMILEWCCPEDDGGSPITGYRLEARKVRDVAVRRKIIENYGCCGTKVSVLQGVHKKSTP